MRRFELKIDNIKDKYLLVFLLLPMLVACASSSEIQRQSHMATQHVMPPAAAEANGSIYHANTSLHLFEDVKARRIGDLITILLEEKTNASKKASTSAKKNTDVAIPNPVLFGRGVTDKGVPILNTEVNSSLDFSGEGDSSQSNSLSGNITVTVVNILPNGNLVVEGEKWLTLNQGSEVIRITGIVRPIDVSPQNTVLSTSIGNAEITYSGKGMVADSNKAGWLTRFFNSAWWPL